VNNPQPQPQPQSGMGAWFKTHSTTITIVAIGIVGGIAFLKKPQAQNNGVPLSATGDYSGLARDDQGRPIIYRDVADTFINYYKTEGSYNTVAPNPTQPVASAPVTVNVNPASPVEHPIEHVGFIRTRFNSGVTKAYDTANTQGVPLRATPGGKQIGFVSYGSQISLTGQPTSSTSNFAGSSVSADKGSQLWFPVQGGWISGYDLDVASTP